MLKQKNEMLLMILIIYLLTMIAFIFLKENTVLFIVLLTVLSACLAAAYLRTAKANDCYVNRIIETYEGCLANEYPGHRENDEHGLGLPVKREDSVINRIKKLVNLVNETSLALNQYAQGILEASCSMNTLNGEFNDKTDSVCSNADNIEKNINETNLLLSDVMENVFVIASSTEEMSNTITTLASASEQTSSGVEQVSQLVEQISFSIDNIASSAIDVSASVDSIVTSVKEINHSLNTVNRNCERSISITSDAGSKARYTNSIINDLDNSAKQIAKIVSVINKISNQTNMLALNAAIEAAGAGEAGKGFAVVAGEVKALANQTAKATEEIRQQIENMQENMSKAVAAVAMINEVIEEITSIANTIGASVTEQYVTTGEISNAVVKSAEKVNAISMEIGQVAGNAQNAARNIMESSNGIKDIAQSASELSTASNDVAKNAEKSASSIYNLTVAFQGVSQGTQGISANIDQFYSALKQYRELATQLQQYSGHLTEASQKMDLCLNQ